MKKFMTGLLATMLLLCISVPVFAADKAATIGAAEAKKEVITVSGETEALAVTIQVRDKDGKIIAMATAGTKDKKYEAKIENLNLTANVNYTIYVADYEGGNWTTKDVVYKVEETTKPAATEEPKKAANTADANAISLWSAMIVAGFLAVVIGVKVKENK